jgi:DNA invertase Pin-like site-specific DNA recombinase
MSTKYVIYMRVSTKEQGRSGLGLEAQKRDIQLFLDNYSEVPYLVIGEFTEVQSGSTSKRNTLIEALTLAKNNKAILLVAKLDRLSRQVSFIAGLLEDKLLEFKVASMPHADKFQLHIYAALAEQERDFISQRTKAALREAKARGVKLGGLRDATNERNKAKIQQADEYAQSLWPIIKPMHTSGLNYSVIAKRLNEFGTKTSTGKTFYAQTVKSLILRCSDVLAQN